MFTIYTGRGMIIVVSLEHVSFQVSFSLFRDYLIFLHSKNTIRVAFPFCQILMSMTRFAICIYCEKITRFFMAL